MKRVRLRKHRFLSLYQTKTDSGSPIAFEIVRANPCLCPMCLIFPPSRELLARQVFETLSLLMEIYGPKLKPGLITKIVNRSRAHKAQNRAEMKSLRVRAISGSKPS